MLRLSRLEYERKSGAFWYAIFRQSPKTTIYRPLPNAPKTHQPGDSIMKPAAEIDKRELLSQGALFSQLSDEDLDSLTRFAKHKRVRAREVLFHKADPGNQMCLIVKGRVKLSTVSPEGKEMMFGILEDGDFFGEMSLLDGNERSATATAARGRGLVSSFRNPKSATSSAPRGRASTSR